MPCWLWTWNCLYLLLNVHLKLVFCSIHSFQQFKFYWPHKEHIKRKLNGIQAKWWTSNVLYIYWRFMWSIYLCIKDFQSKNNCWMPGSQQKSLNVCHYWKFWKETLCLWCGDLCLFLWQNIKNHIFLWIYLLCLNKSVWEIYQIPVS